MYMDRNEMSRVIAERIIADRLRLKQMWLESQPVKHFFIDGLLPEDVALTVTRGFPEPEHLSLKSSLRERKRTGIEVDQYAPCIGDCLFAFQHTEENTAITE